MSETDYDYTDGATLADQMFEPQEATADDDTDFSSWSDDEIDFYLAEDDDSGDETSYEEPVDIEALVQEGLAQGMDPYIAGAQARARADAQWAQIQARNEYDAHVRYQQAMGEANEQAQGLIEEAARRHDVPQSARDGTLAHLSNWILVENQRAAFDTGNQEALEWLQGPEGARWAIDAAGQYARIRAVSEVGTGVGVDRIPNNAHSAKMRAAYDDYMRS